MKRYLFDTWYGSLVVWWGTVGVFLLIACVEIFGRVHLPRVVDTVVVMTSMFMVAVASLLGIGAFLRSLFLKRWGRAVVQLLTGLASVAVAVCVFAALVFFSMFGPSEDHFADDLVIPGEVMTSLVVPDSCNEAEFKMTADIYRDAFAKAVFGALERDGGEDATVTWDFSSLGETVGSRRSDLMAYLARHPGWWLHEDRGRLCATRRLKTNDGWNHPLHGNYWGNSRPAGKGESDWDYNRATHFQMRTTIGFPYSPFGRGKCGAEHPSVGSCVAALKAGNHNGSSSLVRVGDEGFCIEVFEESARPERRITNAAFAFLKDEFSRLELPDDAAIVGEEQFLLRNGSQPGIYNLTLRINPGEPGTVYLKAYEYTKGTCLSEDRLREESNERVGWSKNLAEKFLYENLFTIYEGDWGKPYAARLEVWFAPDAGGPERKLVERICKIEGWQR